MRFRLITHHTHLSFKESIIRTHSCSLKDSNKVSLFESTESFTSSKLLRIKGVENISIVNSRAYDKDY